MRTGTSRAKRRKKSSREMRRTTIMLPGDLRADAMAYAKEHGLSLGGLIRSVLLAEIEGKRTSFLDRDIVYRGKPLPGAPGHHDDIYR